MNTLELVRNNVGCGRVSYDQTTGNILGRAGKPIGRLVGKYFGVQLWNPETNKFQNAYSHHIAAYCIWGEQAFDKRYSIHHINRNKLDNRLDNLQLLPKNTHQAMHAALNTRSAKIDYETADKIRERYAKGGISQHSLAEEYSLSQGHISEIVRGIKWSSKMKP